MEEIPSFLYNKEDMKEQKEKNVHRFPGHMKKASNQIENQIKNLDFVVAMLDARAPFSTFNDYLFKKFQNKPMLLIINKTDLGDDEVIKDWVNYYKEKNVSCLILNKYTKKSKEILISKIDEILAAKKAKNLSRGIKHSIYKGIIVGVPNTGKSTLINILAAKNVVTAKDSPGVTRSVTWIKINNELYLVDTPGILQPKFEDKKQAFNLALIGSIKQDILPLLDLTVYLLDFLSLYYKDNIEKWIGKNIDGDALYIIKEVATNKVPLLKEGKVDTESACRLILNEYRKGTFGKITLDRI